MERVILCWFHMSNISILHQISSWALALLLFNKARSLSVWLYWQLIKRQEGTERLQLINGCWRQICWYFEWPDCRSAQYHQDSVYTADRASVTFLLIGWCLSTAHFPCRHHHVNMIKLNKYLLIALDKWGRLLSFSWKNGKLIHFSNKLLTLTKCSLL